MSQKAFYRQNPVTGQYERVYPTARRRFVAMFRQFAVGAAVALGVMTVVYAFVDLPKERALRAENERLKMSVGLLDRRADEAIAVIGDIAARDDNFYRVVMQAEPLGAARRYAGLERRRNYEHLDSLSDAELVGDLSQKLDVLDQLVATQSRSFDFLRGQAAKLRERSSHIPAIQPVSEKSLRAMASGYGYRRDPIYGTSKFHEGMDFSAPPGTPVYATGDGRVLSADWNSGYGNLIEIDHGYSYVTRYAHLSEMLVRPGQSVRRGDLIGRVGNTGKSTGPHLHYEVRLNGVPQNPVHYYYYDLTPAQYDEMIRQAENAGHVMD
ncbi:MAG: M23 family metallopeptidase [Muribaculaceae bacterium]|nr:M23 family metallopeptidase [Muribaculaceae bacterium]